ncbi:MAG: uracil-DNA glycosylase, partial [Anaerolineae bacterium]|nr:uracil-DNA glycosylase [Anaerolineae bacterium]
MTNSPPLTDWIPHIPLLQTGYHQDLADKVNALRRKKTIYPPQSKLFLALELTPFSKIKVVLLGQDPYHGQGQGHGLAFSVPDGVRPPPSLRNIFKEITADIYNGQPQDFSTDLTRWAKQGVLLLNAALSVEANKAGSHKNLGWHRLTDEIVAQLSQQREHLVFLLWGSHAQAKATLVDETNHLVLQAPHPSPLSAGRGFFGCRHFSQTNAYLAQH